MIVTPIKTSKVYAGKISLLKLLDKYIDNVGDGSVLVITSKIVALCENSVVPINKTDKLDLIHKEADLYLDGDPGKYGIRFTIKHNTLIPTAGIDESNTNAGYVLWPKNPQKTANEVRKYLANRFGRKNIGVLITDSTCSPLRLGTYGISIAHSGFKATHNYVGTKDLFGKPFKVSRSNIAGGLAAAAVVTMGEGTEKTPLCLIEDIPFVKFTGKNPTKNELQELAVSPDDDLFEPFLQAVNWKSKNIND